MSPDETVQRSIEYGAAWVAETVRPPSRSSRSQLLPAVPEASAIWNTNEPPPASVADAAERVPGPTAPGARRLPEASVSGPAVPLPPSVAASTVISLGPFDPFTSSVPAATVVAPAKVLVPASATMPPPEIVTGFCPTPSDMIPVKLTRPPAGAERVTAWLSTTSPAKLAVPFELWVPSTTLPPVPPAAARNCTLSSRLLPVVEVAPSNVTRTRAVWASARPLIVGNCLASNVEVIPSIVVTGAQDAPSVLTDHC